MVRDCRFPIPYWVLCFVPWFLRSFVVPCDCLDFIYDTILHICSLVDFVLLVIRAKGCPDTFPLVGGPASSRTVSIWLSAGSINRPADGYVHAVAVSSPLNGRVAISLLHDFFLGGQNRKHGRATHTSPTSLGLHRSQLAMTMRVHVQIIFPLPHFSNRCCCMSVRPHWLHLFDSTSRNAASRSFVGVSSFIAMYHIDFSRSDIGALFRFCQTCFYGVIGYFRIIPIFGAPLTTMSIAHSTPYILFLKADIVSDFRVARYYAMLVALILR
jgi:hypothetical protein